MKKYLMAGRRHPTPGGPPPRPGLSARSPSSPGTHADHIDSIADIGLLFDGHFTPERGITDNDFLLAASTLGVEVAAIIAVAVVETLGNAFDGQGRPTILYERHYFHRLTQGRFDATHPAISQATAGGYGTFSAQYPKLAEAWQLAPDAALRSASWGRFQIMGNNFLAAGFTSAAAMVLAHARAEPQHLRAFVQFLAHNKPMLGALRRKDWETFALLYNGPGYKKNRYDEKMASAYARIKAAAQQFPPGQH
jgi:hypothetical protein